MCLKRNLEYLRQNTENHQNRNMERYESEKKQKEKARKKEYNSKYDAEYFSLDGYNMVRKAEKQDLEILENLAVQMWDSHSVSELITEFSEIMEKRNTQFF